MRIAMEDLKLDQLYVVYPGVGGSYQLDSAIRVVAVEDLESTLDALLKAPPGR
jgi:hypothetical protein